MKFVELKVGLKVVLNRDSSCANNSLSGFQKKGTEFVIAEFEPASMNHPDKLDEHTRVTMTCGFVTYVDWIDMVEDQRTEVTPAETIKPEEIIATKEFTFDPQVSVNAHKERLRFEVAKELYPFMIKTIDDYGGAADAAIKAADVLLEKLERK